MYNVHLPIMLESERQAVYRERKSAALKLNKDYVKHNLIYRFIMFASGRACVTLQSDRKMESSLP